MKTDVIDNPENFCADIRGKITNSNGDVLIFQRSHGKLQKKIGPIIPTNPRTRKQQLNRLLFRAAVNNASNLTEDQKQLYKNRIPIDRPGMTWLLQAFKEFLKPNRFNNIRFDEAVFFGGIPQRDAYRLDEITFDDAFLINNESLPLDRQAVETAYPTINLSSLFNEEE